MDEGMNVSPGYNVEFSVRHSPVSVGFRIRMMIRAIPESTVSRITTRDIFPLYSIAAGRVDPGSVLCWAVVEKSPACLHKSP